MINVCSIDIGDDYVVMINVCSIDIGDDYVVIRYYVRFTVTGISLDRFSLGNYIANRPRLILFTVQKNREAALEIVHIL